MTKSPKNKKNQAKVPASTAEVNVTEESNNADEQNVNNGGEDNKDENILKYIDKRLKDTEKNNNQLY